MLFYAVSTVGVFRANATVVGSLWARITALWKSWWQVCLWIPQEVLLLESEPKVRIIIVNG